MKSVVDASLLVLGRLRNVHVNRSHWHLLRLDRRSCWIIICIETHILLKLTLILSVVLEYNDLRRLVIRHLALLLRMHRLMLELHARFSDLFAELSLIADDFVDLHYVSG